jgi:hypothetical protein
MLHRAEARQLVSRSSSMAGRQYPFDVAGPGDVVSEGGHQRNRIKDALMLPEDGFRAGSKSTQEDGGHLKATAGVARASTKAVSK